MSTFSKTEPLKKWQFFTEKIKSLQIGRARNYESDLHYYIEKMVGENFNGFIKRNVGG